MQNSLSDPFLISQYHQEYLTLINHYDSFKRPGMFIRYYNINYQESGRHPVVESTFDLYDSSQILFNIYELTPIYSIAPITNSTAFLAEKKGQIYDGVSSIVVYTIQTPHVNDLITFYDPVKSGEIFRVMNIRTSINAYYSEPKLTWYEMDLEVAPIKDVGTLKISKHYVYDTHQKTYHNYSDYNTKMAFIETVNSVILQIRQFYSRVHDLYKSDYLVPLISNHSINNFKTITSSNDNYTRVFNDLEKPYGFSDLFPDTSTISTDYDQSSLQVYNLTTEEIEDCFWDQIEGTVSLSSTPSGSSEVENLATLLTLTRDLQTLINSNLQYF